MNAWSHELPKAIPGGLSTAGEGNNLQRQRRRETELVWRDEVDLSSTDWSLIEAMATRDHGMVATFARGRHDVPLDAKCRLGRHKKGRCRVTVLVVEGVDEFRERSGKIWFRRERAVA